MHFSVVSSFGYSLSVCLRVLVVVVCVCVDAPFFPLSCVCVNKTWIQVFLVAGFVCFICVYVYVYVRQMYTGGSHHQRILNTTIFIHIYIVVLV